MSSDAPSLNATAASLLGFLQNGPKTGWELVQAVEASVGYFWNVTRSQVYREMKSLAVLGYVTEKPAGPRDKVPYAITVAGKEAFADWIARPPGADLLRVPLVLTVFFGRHMPPELLRRHLQRAAIEHQTRLDEYCAMQDNSAAKDEYQRETLKLGIAYERTLLAWIESLPWTKEKKGKKS